jgi:glycosyltransferase involved in cell wall biosynthesis
MATPEPSARTPPFAEPTGTLAVLPPRRERLAIVSTRNKLCGIAAYTQALERQLTDIFDITVFDLDQYLLRSPHPRVRTLGDRHIKDICHEIADFDAVNLQLEHGTLGRLGKDIHRRFSWLVGAAPRLSVTFHTLNRPPVFPLADFANAILKLRWRTAVSIHAAHRRNHQLSSGMTKRLRAAQRRKPVSAIVHNRRDLADARYLHGFNQVFDHPLSFLSSAEVEAVRTEATRRRFPQLDALPRKAVLVGVFGFLNDYKGFGTSVRALYHLPDEYHLLVFGGTHPNEIPQNKPIHPYVATLLEEGHVDATLYDQLRGPERIALNLDIERHFGNLFGKHPRDLSPRLHFMGAPDDADFLAGMAICNIVVLPYLEVGQSASGPISQATELGCRIIASRTHAFLEFARYHPETIEFFDIGNHLELAERIIARRQYAVRRERPRYTVETNKAIYLTANSAPPDPASGFWRRRAAAVRTSVEAPR